MIDSELQEMPLVYLVVHSARCMPFLVPYNVWFNAADLSRHLLYYRLCAGNEFVQTKHMIVLK